MSDLFYPENSEQNEDDGYPSPFFTDPLEGSELFIGAVDIDPEFLGQVSLNEDGTVFANVYSYEEDIDLNSIDLFGFRDLIGLVDPEESRVHFELQDLPDDFDESDPSVRGPFPDLESLKDWLEETGLWDLAEWYYDADNKQYFIDLDDSP